MFRLVVSSATLFALASAEKQNLLTKAMSSASRVARMWQDSKALETVMVKTALDSPCSANWGTSEDKCLWTADWSCMWISTDKGNLCLPCALGTESIMPCPPIGSVFAMKKVKDCRMKCSHQTVITKDSPCTDVTSFTIAPDQCFSKGASVFAQCMWTQYTDKAGKKKNICGPAGVMGLGNIPCWWPGDMGPEGPGSTTDACISMASMKSNEYGLPCDFGLGIPAITHCKPTAPPPPLGPTPGPPSAVGIKTDENAPDYVVVNVEAPYGIKQWTQSAAVGAQTAGWPMGSALPPDAPVVIFGPHPLEGPTLPPQIKAMFGPPPPGIPGIPPPGYGPGTAPPPSLIQEQKKQKKSTKFRVKLLRAHAGVATG